jgi:hypothetical protein
MENKLRGILGMLTPPNGLLELQRNGALDPVTANRNMLAQSARARENQFQTGILATPWYQEFVQQYGERPDLNTPDYDYRSAWAAGIRPQRDPYDQNRYHWPSMLPDGRALKSQNHTTMWMETFMQITGVDPRSLGINTPQDAESFFKKR